MLSVIQRKRKVQIELWNYLCKITFWKHSQK